MYHDTSCGVWKLCPIHRSFIAMSGIAPSIYSLLCFFPILFRPVILSVAGVPGDIGVPSDGSSSLG
jgi:hypothetical protein